MITPHMSNKREVLSEVSFLSMRRNNNTQSMHLTPKNAYTSPLILPFILDSLHSWSRLRRAIRALRWEWRGCTLLTSTKVFRKLLVVIEWSMAQ